MAEPLFKVGDLVRMIRAVRHATHPAETFFEAVGSVIPGGVFTVTAALPALDGQPQYRIRGGNPEHERVVREVQITHASGPQPRR
jgi:hypothetical protein